MPFTAGGGVRSEADVRALLLAGADKVSLNTALIEAPEVTRACAEAFGAQCVIASIDARRSDDGGWDAMIDAGRRPAGISAASSRARRSADGAGEILLTSIDRDGMMEGFDLELIATSPAASTCP